MTCKDQLARAGGALRVPDALGRRARHDAPGEGGFELQASTFSGALRIRSADAVPDATSTNRSLRGTVGDGSAVLVATTFSGSITVETR